MGKKTFQAVTEFSCQSVCEQDTVILTAWEGRIASQTALEIP